MATAGWIHFHPFFLSLWWSSLPLPLSREFSSSSVSTAFPGSSGPRRWMPAGVVGDFVLVEPYGDYASTTTATTGSHEQFQKYINKVDTMELHDAALGSFFKDGGIRTDQETCHGTPKITITVRVVSRFCAVVFCFPPVLSAPHTQNDTEHSGVSSVVHTRSVPHTRLHNTKLPRVRCVAVSLARCPPPPRHPPCVTVM